MRFLFILTLAIAALFGASTGSSYAQATRTWVSGVGDDVNPCSRTAPCKTFAGAISKTAASGEINVLDPGAFGAVTITKSITIRSEFEAGVLATLGSSGIIVNTASATDKVVLEGLDIDGAGTGGIGVRILAGAQVEIVRCAIRRFTGNGVNMVSSTANSRVVISNSMINFNGGGLNVQGNGVGNIGVVVDTKFDANTTFAVQATGAGNALAIVNSYLMGSPTGLSLVSGATATSIGPSNFVAGAGAFTTTSPFK